MSDVSAVTNHFPTANEGFNSALSSTVFAGGVNVPLTTMAGLTNGNIFVGIVQPGTASQQVFTGTVDIGGSRITNVVWTRGTNVDHSTGSQVVDYVTGTAINMITKGLLVEHKQTGAHGNTTHDSITTAGNIDVNDSSTAIRDTTDNELIKFARTASAVNEITVTNAATGNGPTVSATGGDTNIDLNLVTKGTGDFKFNGITSNFGTWTTWSPSITNLSLGNGTLTAKYRRDGKQVFLHANIVFGTTTSVGGDITFSLPVTTAAYGGVGTVQIGSANLFDTSAARLFQGTVNIPSTTTLVVRPQAADLTYLYSLLASSTVPFTWATGDEISFTATYETV